MTEYVVLPRPTSCIVLTRSSDHINDILAIGLNVTGKLTDFVFNSCDVSYNAHCGMPDVTDDALIRLAEACPKLKKVVLQDTKGLSNAVLVAFNITMGPGITGKLWRFTFNTGLYSDDNDMFPSMYGVKDDTPVRFAKACPNLRKLKLHYIGSLTDACLVAFFEHCPTLTAIELLGSERGISGSAFTALERNTH